MQLSPELKAELIALASSARAHLEHAASLGLTGLPVRARDPGPPPRVSAPAAPPQVVSRAAPPSSVPAPPPAAKLDPTQRRAQLQVLSEEAASCTRCVLHEKRSRSVFARGSPDAELVFVGEGPGRDEDLQGLPFVGAAGQLLDKMIGAMGYGRDDVYICNVVKCRPPENRTPRPEEAIACSRFLIPQLHAVSPKVVVALGRCAAQALGVAEATGSWRGRWGEFQGIPVLPTYHPAFLLRTPEQKRTVWEDLQLVMARLGRAPQKRGS
jgi:uracil-DNA glycosylase family 4